MATATSSVWTTFTALHIDIANPRDVHEHTWRVEVFWPSKTFGDKRTREYLLRERLRELEGTRLPDRLARAEDLAEALTVDLVALSVRVSRDDENHAATYTRTESEHWHAVRRNRGRRY